MSDYEILLNELRTALAHLDDPLRLENHALARRIPFVADAPEVSRGQLLRRTLRLAIEALDPGPGIPVSAPEARAYQVLYRYAIAKQGMPAIAAELDIGDRQAYRDLRQAIAALASTLFEDAQPDEQAPTPATAQARMRAARVREEVERLSGEQSQEVDLSELVAAVVENGRRLAAERGIGIRLVDETPGLRVGVNRVMLRQALLNLLSHLLRVQQGGDIELRISRSEATVTIEFSYQHQNTPPALRPDDPQAVASHLFTSLGLRWAHSEADDGRGQVNVHIPLIQERCLLIIDDNQGLITLLRRNLRGQPYQVHEATDAGQAVEIVERLRPDIVILDIMMPGRDGWEVLQALRASEAGHKTAIIVCSVINDPQLSAALGADAFLHKPVDKASLLQALTQAIGNH